jgi:hypothetical protein
MGDDHVRDELGQFLHRGAGILVDVYDQVGGRQASDARHLDALGPAHLGYALDAILGVHAKTGAPDDLRGEAKVEQKLGDTRHQRNDARLRTRNVVALADGIDQFAFVGWREGHAGSASARLPSCRLF